MAWNNSSRIIKAADAMEQAGYLEAAGSDNETALWDLLADLRHWADHNGIDFHKALDVSYTHYSAEKRNEEDSKGNFAAA